MNLFMGHAEHYANAYPASPEGNAEYMNQYFGLIITRKVQQLAGPVAAIEPPENKNDNRHGQADKPHIMGTQRNLLGGGGGHTVGDHVGNKISNRNPPV